jgi:hypothetical protein
MHGCMRGRGLGVLAHDDGKSMDACAGILVPGTWSQCTRARDWETSSDTCQLVVRCADEFFAL